MSLGHAMFFASGMYSSGLSILYLGFTPLEGMIFGTMFTLTMSLIFGLFALRTSGVSFLIVTLMFGQTFFLAILYYNEFTFGQDGFSITNYLGSLVIFGKEHLYSNPTIRYNFALILLAFRNIGRNFRSNACTAVFVHWYHFRGNPSLNFSPAMDPARRCRNSNRPFAWHWNHVLSY